MDSQERFENMVGLVEAHQYEWAIWQAAERGVSDEIDALRSRLTEALLDAERAREERNREHVRLNAEWMAKCEKLRKDAERLDWLDAVNRRTNERYGTCYGWRFDLNHNRAALTDHNFPAYSVRAAIDAAIAKEPK